MSSPDWPPSPGSVPTPPAGSGSWGAPDPQPPASGPPSTPQPPTPSGAGWDQPQPPQSSPPPAPGAGWEPQAPTFGPQPPMQQPPNFGPQSPMQQPSPFGPPTGAGAYAGWWRRVGASIIDEIIIGIPTAIIGAIIGGGAGGATGISGTSLSGNYFALLIVGLVIAGVYYGLLMARPGANNGQTWGTQVTGYRVVRDDGRPVDFRFAILRNIVVQRIIGIIPLIGGLILILNYLWPLWDRENQALHDKIVKSHVIRA